MILDEIKKASIIALKEKNQTARTIYGIVSNKAMLETIKKREKGGELTDIDMIQILQKTIKELEEEANNYEKTGNLTEVKTIREQKSILEKYVPKMMSSKEISCIINTLSDKSISNIMKHFKINYPGKCDMKLVSNIAKTFN